MDYWNIEQMAAWAKNLMALREPDFIIGDDPEQPYMKRWYVIPRNGFSNVYLHQILRSDDDRALHDHPSDNTSIILEGGYREITPVWPESYCGPGNQYDELTSKNRITGDILRRNARDPHRLELLDGKPVISLFLTGPKQREWGFWCAGEWVHWEVFTAAGDPGKVGRGCGE